MQVVTPICKDAANDRPGILSGLFCFTLCGEDVKILFDPLGVDILHERVAEKLACRLDVLPVRGYRTAPDRGVWCGDIVLVRFCGFAVGDGADFSLLGV